jgi:hypothetical protein
MYLFKPIAARCQMSCGILELSQELHNIHCPAAASRLNFFIELYQEICEMETVHLLVIYGTLSTGLVALFS